jgi:tagatose-6-phosphate ketose/aldose isomerase
VTDPLSALLLLPDQEKNARGLTNTPREIHQQPDTWAVTFRHLQSMEFSLAGVLAECGIHTGSPNSPDVILAGAGTSDYIGRCLQALLQKHWGCSVRSLPSTDLLTGLPEAILPNRPCVLISFSRSGDSSEGVAVLSLALEKYPQQIRNIVITCNRAGVMANMRGVFPIVLDDAVNDRGLAMTSSFTNMLIAGQYLAFLGASHPYEPILNALTAMGRTLLVPAAGIASTLARNGYRRVCFLGSGALHGVAAECALKVLELNAGRIATLAETFLGVRHGPLSFVDSETLVCAFLSGNPDRSRYEIDLIEEIQSKRLAKDVLVLSPRPAERTRDLSLHLLELNAPADFPDECRPPVDVIVGQLLAMFLSIENGIRPDTPSTGAISRVVSHVRIYPN